LQFQFILRAAKAMEQKRGKAGRGAMIGGGLVWGGNDLHFVLCLEEEKFMYQGWPDTGPTGSLKITTRSADGE